MSNNSLVWGIAGFVVGAVLRFVLHHARVAKSTARAIAVAASGLAIMLSLIVPLLWLAEVIGDARSDSFGECCLLFVVFLLLGTVFAKPGADKETLPW